MLRDGPWVVPAGPVAEWPCRGLQILVRRFDSGPGLNNFNDLGDSGHRHKVCVRILSEKGILMTKEHVDVLRAARSKSVLARREIAKSIAVAPTAAKGEEHRQKMVRVQSAIDAIDRAIADEDGGKATHE